MAPPTQPALPADLAAPTVAVIGGSGLYALLPDAVEVTVTTPYGEPSGPIAVARVGDRVAAFLPRHGPGHRWPPHRIPYRANLWALRALGVRQVLAPCAVGSLRTDLPAGSLVVPDQLLDRTSGRASTYYDDGAVHVEFADPYCPTLRSAALAAAALADRTAPAGAPAAVDGGTMVVVNGPRFSTRAESQAFAAGGATLVNMTGMPEAVLARELALCYATIALVTDLDAGIAGDHPAVTQEEVFTTFAAHTGRLSTLLLDLLRALPDERPCRCARAVDGTAATLP